MLRLRGLLRALLRFLRRARGPLYAEMAVRADEVRVGDRVQPKAHWNNSTERLPVTEIADFGRHLRHVPCLRLMVMVSGASYMSLYTHDELVTIERRID